MLENSVLEDESNHYRKLSMFGQLTGLLIRHGLSHDDAEDFTGCWGGEEFVVIMKGQSLNYAQDWCERLRVELACSRFEGMESVVVTISIGVGSLQPEEAFHNMFRRVDKALYRAKAQGRNRVLVAE